MHDLAGVVQQIFQGQMKVYTRKLPPQLEVRECISFLLKEIIHNVLFGHVPIF